MLLQNEQCLEDIIEVCNRHGYVLGHEDGHGAFTLERVWNLTEKQVEIYHKWLRGADLIENSN